MKKTLIFILLISVVVASTYFLKKKKDVYSCEDCNLIVISLTNLRRDNVGLFNASKLETKNIDKFFKESIRFKNAIAPASLTFTDAYSLFYSLQPNTHRFFNRTDRDRARSIVKNFESYPQILKKNGYSTAAFVSDEDYAYTNGFGDMFDFYFDRQKYLDKGIDFTPWHYNIGSKDLVAPTIEWLKTNKSKKFFLFLQMYDMHCPYTPPEKYKVGFMLKKSSNINFEDCYMTLGEIETLKKNGKTFYKLHNWKSFLEREHDEPVLFQENDLNYLKFLYEAELKYADENLKALFDYLESAGLTKNSVIVFLSEHGDYLGEAGYYMKSAVSARGNLHNANLRFPFMIKLPSLNKGLVQDQLFQSIDFAPTVLEILGINEMDKAQGKSFKKVLGKQSEVNDFVYAYSVRKRDFIDKGKFLVESIQNKEWKLDHYQHSDFDNNEIEKKYYLFNLLNDPEEKINLYREGEDSIFKTMEAARKKTREKYEK